jgi:predicted Zn-dependent peptidase
MRKSMSLLGLILLLVGSAHGAALSQRARSFTLENGMTFWVYERHQIPTFFGIYMAKTGSCDEQAGETGLAHFIEHLSKKGTPVIGTKDYGAEKPILEEMDRIGNELSAELDKGELADQGRIAEMRKKLAELQEQHSAYAVKEEYNKIYSENGGRGRNASTGNDTTQYFISLPANRLELWFLMESEKLKNLVMREYYSERDVINEERRMGVENSPSGSLYEQFINAAFLVHPYRHEVIGYMHDIQTFTKAEALAFFRRNYVPNNLMAALVGDVSFAEVKRLAGKYFGDIPRGAEPSRMLDNEPQQNAERRVTVWFDAEPEILIGFRTPGREARDNIVVEMIAMILSAGDSSRLNRDLVQRRQMAFNASAAANALGERYGSLFMLQGAPRHPHTVAELENEFYGHLEKLKAEPVGEAELRRAINQAEAGLYNGLDRNMVLAMRILGNAQLHNDVDAEFKRVEALKSVTAAEIMAAANKYFIETNRTVGILQRKAEGGEK